MIIQKSLVYDKTDSRREHGILQRKRKERRGKLCLQQKRGANTIDYLVKRPSFPSCLHLALYTEVVRLLREKFPPPPKVHLIERMLPGAEAGEESI